VKFLLAGLDRLTDDELAEPSALPGWSRRHLLAHVASNAEALGRLVSWARTGVENRMYASLEQRAADISSGADRADLRAWVRDSAEALTRAFEELPDEAWDAKVVTAQGRTVPAREIPWMRRRETHIHAVDLRAGTTFVDLPPEFLVALLDDVTRWRAARPGPALVLVTPETEHEIPGEGPPTRVDLPLATAAAWLTGRHTDPALPTLPGWL
jgi:maleylpyruvate isomerase